MNCLKAISIFTVAFIGSTLAAPGFSAEGVIPIGLTYSHSFGPPDSGYWGSLHVPTIDQLGHIAFRADYRDVTYSNYDVAYRASDDQFIARAGDQAPGLAAGVNFRFLSNFQANPRGPAGFTGYVLKTDATHSMGIWAENPAGELRLVAISGGQAPGFADGTTFARFGGPWDPFADDSRWQSGWPPFSINAQGETAFYNVVNQSGDPPTADGIWSEGGGQGLRLVARTGMSVPQFSPGATIAAIVATNETIRINDAGKSAFLAIAVDPDYVGGGGYGLFTYDPIQGLAVAARSEQEAPGRPGTRFGALSVVSLNNAGQLVFVAEQVAGDVTRQFNYGIWSGAPENLQLVAETGAPAPGVDGVFSELRGSIDVSSRPVLNGQGQVAFAARFTGPGVDESNDSGIWVKDLNGALRLVAREGESSINQKLLDDLFSDPAHLLLNNHGQVAVMTQNGIWATDLAEHLHNIVHLGDRLPTGNSFSSELSTGVANFFSMSQSTGGEDGMGMGFNDRGEIVFHARLSNYDSGVYLSRAVAIPEASCLALAVPGALFLGLRRRRLR